MLAALNKYCPISDNSTYYLVNDYAFDICCLLLSAAFFAIRASATGSQSRFSVFPGDRTCAPQWLRPRRGCRQTRLRARNSVAKRHRFLGNAVERRREDGAGAVRCGDTRRSPTVRSISRAYRSALIVYASRPRVAGSTRANGEASLPPSRSRRASHCRISPSFSRREWPCLCGLLIPTGYFRRTRAGNLGHTC
jgi:hypothetical protein